MFTPSRPFVSGRSTGSVSPSQPSRSDREAPIGYDVLVPDVTQLLSAIAAGAPRAAA
jgi:hypothetical protein